MPPYQLAVKLAITLRGLLVTFLQVECGKFCKRE
jgi:hypothetical protein